MGKRSVQLPLVDHDQVEINIEQCAPFDDTDSVTQSLRKATGLSFTPKEVGSEINRTLSTVTVVPAMTLSWHNIVAKPIVKDSANKTILDKIFRVEDDADGPQLHREKILDNVFGVAEPGEVLALMGSSGAGKTSLMNILTHRNLNTLEVTGAVKINGQPVDKNLMRKVSAYVEQDDMFVATMTVKEHLNFVSVLKMGKTHSARDQRRRVRMVMDDLELHRCADTIIGSPKGKKGLSGGEKKRLAFASEVSVRNGDAMMGWYRSSWVKLAALSYFLPSRVTMTVQTLPS
uniref:ABC transporter domain-containing protein n=1 Tax=Steinernema glaseri TaxID=37863 RepID=A0A1I8A7M2_9BILA